MPLFHRPVRRQRTPSEIPYLRKGIFRRFLRVFALVVGITTGAMMLAQDRTHSGLIAGAVGLMAGLSGSVLSAFLWSRRFEMRCQELIRALEAGSPAAAEELARTTNDRLFAEVIVRWQRTVRKLQDDWQEKHNEATRSYETLSELIRMMATAVDERAAYLRGHSERVARYASDIAIRLGLPEEEVEKIRLSALLHDIGTLGIEDYLVLKDAPLSPEEFEIVKAHTVKGAGILRPIEMLRDLIPGVELHHEALDGMGYPYGLRGEQIPLMARIIAVADSFDAMTTPRPYQSAMNPDYVMKIMGRLAGSRYDAEVVAALDALVTSGAIQVKKLKIPVSFRMRRPIAEIA
jgi:putative nucleotidyltransferase with HDIG domain